MNPSLHFMWFCICHSVISQAHFIMQVHKQLIIIIWLFQEENKVLQKSAAEKNLSSELKSETDLSSEESNIGGIGKAQKLVLDEYDIMFRDMEPVISKPHIIHVEEEQVTTIINKFALATEISESAADGWDEDFDDWNDSQEGITKTV